MESKLDTRCCKICGVVSFKDYTFSQVLDYRNKLSSSFLSINNIEEYYIILHDDKETLHLHYCVSLKKVVRLSTFINIIVQALDISALAVSIQKCSSINAMIRYFLHSDEIDKKKYELIDIISNMSTSFIKDRIDNDDDDSFSIDTLIKIVVESKYNQVMIMRSLGLKVFHKYRYEIKTLIDDSWNTDLEYQKIGNQDIPF